MSRDTIYCESENVCKYSRIGIKIIRTQWALRTDRLAPIWLLQEVYQTHLTSFNGRWTKCCPLLYIHAFICSVKGESILLIIMFFFFVHSSILIVLVTKTELCMMQNTHPSEATRQLSHPSSLGDSCLDLSLVMPVGFRPTKHHCSLSPPTSHRSIFCSSLTLPAALPSRTIPNFKPLTGCDGGGVAATIFMVLRSPLIHD